MRVGQRVVTDLTPLELSISTDGLAMVKSICVVNLSDAPAYVDIYSTTSDASFTEGKVYLYRELKLERESTLILGEEDFPASDVGVTLYGKHATDNILTIATSSTSGVHVQYSVIDEADRCISGCGSSGGSSSPTRILLTPADFIPSSSYRQPGEIASDGGKSRASTSSQNYFAQKAIPIGSTATEVYIYSNSGISLEVFEATIIDGLSGTSLGTGVGNAAITLSSSVVGDDEAYITIKYNPTSLSDYIYGGYITLT